MTAKVKCAECGAENPYTAAQCAICGARLATGGTTNNPDDKTWLIGCAIPIVLAGLLVWQCSGGDGGSESTFRTQAMAYDAVKARLRDPGSAEFSGVFVSTTGAVCGLVNSKNGFGGMSGAQRFIVIGNVAVLEEDAPLGSAWAEHCAQ